MNDNTDAGRRVAGFGESEFTQELTVSDDRRQGELDGLLRMAEELQEGLEGAGQRFLTNLLFAFVIILLIVVGVGAVLFSAVSSLYQLLTIVVAAIFLIVTAVVILRNQARLQVRQRRDKNALNEVLAILQEVEPVLRATGDWSRLDEAAFRIRLSRFNVGRAAIPVATNDRGADRFMRTMRFLLDENNGDYRQLVVKAFRNIDVAVKNVTDAHNFDEVLRRAGRRLEVVKDPEEFQALINASTVGTGAVDSVDTDASKTRLTDGRWGGLRSYAMFDDGRIVLDTAAKRDFDASQLQLQIQLGDLS